MEIGATPEAGTAATMVAILEDEMTCPACQMKSAAWYYNRCPACGEIQEDQAPIVTVPKAAAPDRGSVGEQIQREWAVLRRYIYPLGSRTYEGADGAIRKLDALIGYER